MQQKLVSIWLTDEGARDCEVKEHLGSYLTQGWRIKEFKPLDGSGGGETVSSGGWIIVLLEK